MYVQCVRECMSSDDLSQFFFTLLYLSVRICLTGESWPAGQDCGIFSYDDIH